MHSEQAAAVPLFGLACDAHFIEIFSCSFHCDITVI